MLPWTASTPQPQKKGATAKSTGKLRAAENSATPKKTTPRKKNYAQTNGGPAALPSLGLTSARAARGARTRGPLWTTKQAQTNAPRPGGRFVFTSVCLLRSIIIFRGRSFLVKTPKNHPFMTVFRVPPATYYDRINGHEGTIFHFP